MMNDNLRAGMLDAVRDAKGEALLCVNDGGDAWIYGHTLSNRTILAFISAIAQHLQCACDDPRCVVNARRAAIMAAANGGINPDYREH